MPKKDERTDDQTARKREGHTHQITNTTGGRDREGRGVQVKRRGGDVAGLHMFNAWGMYPDGYQVTRPNHAGAEQYAGFSAGWLCFTGWYQLPAIIRGLAMPTKGRRAGERVESTQGHQLGRSSHVQCQYVSMVTTVSTRVGIREQSNHPNKETPMLQFKNGSHGPP